MNNVKAIPEDWGESKPRTFRLYDFEYESMIIYFRKLKRNRQKVKQINRSTRKGEINGITTLK